MQEPLRSPTATSQPPRSPTATTQPPRSPTATRQPYALGKTFGTPKGPPTVEPTNFVSPSPLLPSRCRRRIAESDHSKLGDTKRIPAFDADIDAGPECERRKTQNVEKRKRGRSKPNAPAQMTERQMLAYVLQLSAVEAKVAPTLKTQEARYDPVAEASRPQWGSAKSSGTQPLQDQTNSVKAKPAAPKPKPKPAKAKAKSTKVKKQPKPTRREAREVVVGAQLEVEWEGQYFECTVVVRKFILERYVPRKYFLVLVYDFRRKSLTKWSWWFTTQGRRQRKRLLSSSLT